MNSRYFTTGIGSLPFKDAESAVKYVFAAYSLPFFPQLVPMLEEVEPKGMTPDQVVQRQPATQPFFERLGGVQAVKLQVAGPVTLQRAAGDGVDRWDWVEQVTLAWVRKTREVSEGPIHFIWDDALLAAEGSTEDLARFQAFGARLAKLRVALGLHCCMELPLARLTDAAKNLTLAVDAHVVDLISPRSVGLAADHVRGGGRFVLGVVDTRRRDVGEGKAADLWNRIRRAWADVPPGGIAGLSGGCGTALHDEAYERGVSSVLRACAGVHF